MKDNRQTIGELKKIANYLKNYDSFFVRKIKQLLVFKMICILDQITFSHFLSSAIY